MNARGLAATSTTPPFSRVRMGFCHPNACMYHYIVSLNEQEPSFRSFLLPAICIINLNIITMSFSFSYLSNAFGSGSERKKEQGVYNYDIFMLHRMVLVFAV